MASSPTHKNRPNTKDSASDKGQKKLALVEISQQVSGEFPNAFRNGRERFQYENDFRLLVRTFVMDGSFDEFEQIKQRRFRELQGHTWVQKYDAKAKAAGKEATLEQAKKHAADIHDIDAMNKEAAEEYKLINGATPQSMNAVLPGVMAKLQNDVGPENFRQLQKDVEAEGACKPQ